MVAAFPDTLILSSPLCALTPQSRSRLSTSACICHWSGWPGWGNKALLQLSGTQQCCVKSLVEVPPPWAASKSSPLLWMRPPWFFGCGCHWACSFHSVRACVCVSGSVRSLFVPFSLTVIFVLLHFVWCVCVHLSRCPCTCLCVCEWVSNVSVCECAGFYFFGLTNPHASRWFLS